VINALLPSVSTGGLVIKKQRQKYVFIYKKNYFCKHYLKTHKLFQTQYITQFYTLFFYGNHWKTHSKNAHAVGH